MNNTKVLLVNPLITDYAVFDLWLYPFGLDFIGYLLRKNFNFGVDFIDFLRVGKDLSRHRVYYTEKKDGKGKFYKRAIQRASEHKASEKQYHRYFIYGMPEEIILESLKEYRGTDIILITSLMSYWYEGAVYSLQIIRKVFPDIPVIIGGMWPIQYPEHSRKILQDYSNCYIIDTNDINSLYRLLESLGYINKTSDADIYSEFRDYKQMGIPDYLGFYPLISSIGCPFNCSFCLSPVLHKNNYSQRNTDNIIKEILRGSEMRKDLVFFDDALLYNKERHIKPILNEINKRGIHGSHFHLPNGINTSMMDDELAYLFKRLNFKTIRLSVEGFDRATMYHSNSKVDFSRFIEALDMLKKSGIERSNIGFYLLFGLPGQDFDSLSDFAIEFTERGYYVGLSELTPVPGTRVFETLKARYPEIQEDPININNSTFIHNFLDISDKFIELKSKIKKIRAKSENTVINQDME